MTDWQPRWLKHPPHRWQPGTLDRAALDAAATALAQGPGFDALARRFAERWLGTLDAHPELRAVFRNSARYLLLVQCVVLHHRRDAADPRSGPTPTALLDFYAHTLRGKLAVSRSQVQAMVAHARLLALLQAAETAADRRLQPLRPTPKLQRILQDWVAGFLQAAWGEPALRLPAPPQAMAAQPGLVGEMFSYRMAALREDRFVLWEAAPGMRWVLAHDYGYRAFLHLLQASRPQPDGTALVPLTTAELAARAGVARGTVRQLLAGAAAQGWFEAGAPPRHWRLSAEGVRMARHWVALELLWMHGLAGAAWERLTVPEPSGRDIGAAAGAPQAGAAA